MIVFVLVITLIVSPVIFYASTNTKSMPTTANSPRQASIGFDKKDVNLINQTTDQSIKFLLSLQTTNGAIAESPSSNIAYTRDLALAIIALLLGNRTQEATLAINFILGLPQGSSYYTIASFGTTTSPSAWFQEYSTNGSIEERSLRGEDQGMVLFALATYYKATKDTSLIASNWPKIENSANFILYLQNTPGRARAFDGLYRHGDNWQDRRQENINSATGQPIYWPYWPEYYQWEEENMRMIMGLKGAILLASSLGYIEDANSWRTSVNLALKGLYGGESMYEKYEAYDYFGSVLWGLQSNLTAAKDLLSAMPSGLYTSLGIKDLPWGNFIGSADTIDYMTCLVRVGNYVEASDYLHIIVSKFQAGSGGFYNSLSLNGSTASGPENSFGASRFVYFASVALDANTILTKF
jgi:hypothetical protein